MLRYDETRAVWSVPLDRQTGLYRVQHRDRETLTEFGVVNGRLRLRTSRALQHITAVIGDPEWTDYRIDVDLYTYADPTYPPELRGKLSQAGRFRGGRGLDYNPRGWAVCPRRFRMKGERRLQRSECDRESLEPRSRSLAVDGDDPDRAACARLRTPT